MLENFSNTILAGNFGIVCEKLSKKSIAQSLPARNNCSLITQVETVSHRIVLVLHSLVRRMTFLDQAMIILRFSSTFRKTKSSQRDRSCAAESAQVETLVQKPLGEHYSFFISKGSLRLNRRGSRVQPCRINLARGRTRISWTTLGRADGEECWQHAEIKRPCKVARECRRVHHRDCQSCGRSGISRFSDIAYSTTTWLDSGDPHERHHVLVRSPSKSCLAEKMECMIEVPKPKIPRAEPLHLPSLSLQ
jgi:hypothetical protein